MNEYINLFNFIRPFILEERLAVLEKVLNERTNYITVALEDINHSQNASAVLRTCECFGIQNVHVIENQHKYDLNPDVTKGSDKWLTLTKYKKGFNNSLVAINHLKSKGYRIIATTPHTSDTELNRFDLKSGKIALFFGTELTGLSNEVLENADEFLKIPMYGFTESFNLSVSASIILHQLTDKLRNSNIDWRLNENEKYLLNLVWAIKSLKHPVPIIKDFCKKNNLEFRELNSRLYHLSI